MTLPLEGLLVVSIEQAVAAPACTVRLADAGARVIKIERQEGETARHYDRAVLGTSAYFAWLNRGKESVVLDIKQPDDRALLSRMLGKADVFVQNLAPGAAQRQRLGAAELIERYPRLITVDIVGYAQDTPYRNMRAYDMLIQAESGLCAVTGVADEPVKVGVSIADICAGTTAHAAVLEALIERSLTGKGKAIEIAMFDAMADLMSIPLLHHDYAGRHTPRVGLSHAAIYPYGSFSCVDGDIIVVVQNPGEWLRFCTGVLEMPSLADDEKFADNPTRLRNREALRIIIAETFAKLERQAVIDRLESNQLAWSNISTVADLSGHPALRRMDIEVPGGVMRGVGSALRRDVKGGAVPALGAHTDRVRREFGA